MVFQTGDRTSGTELSLPPKRPAHPGQATSGPGRPKVTCPLGRPHPAPALTRTAGWHPGRRAGCAAASSSSAARPRGSPATARAPLAARSGRRPPCSRPPPPAAPRLPALPLVQPPPREPRAAMPVPPQSELGILARRSPRAPGSPSSEALCWRGQGQGRGRGGTQAGGHARAWR